MWKRAVGRIVLPPGQKVCIDSSPFIYTVEQHPQYESLMIPVWQAANAGQITLLGSELLITETLPIPLRTGNMLTTSGFRDALFSSSLGLLPITVAILERAAQMRAASVGLRAPDAIHLATAEPSSCSMFLTNDVRLARVLNLPFTVVVLDDVLNAPW